MQFFKARNADGNAIVVVTRATDASSTADSRTATSVTTAERIASAARLNNATPRINHTTARFKRTARITTAGGFTDAATRLGTSAGLLVDSASRFTAATWLDIATPGIDDPAPRLTRAVTHAGFAERRALCIATRPLIVTTHGESLFWAVPGRLYRFVAVGTLPYSSSVLLPSLFGTCLGNVGRLFGLRGGLGDPLRR